MRELTRLSNTGGALFEYSHDEASNVTHRLNKITSVDQDYGTPDKLNRMTQRRVVKQGGNVLSHEAYDYDPARPALLTSTTRLEDGRRDTFDFYLNGELKWSQYGLEDTGADASSTANGVIASTGINGVQVSANAWANPQRRVDYVWDPTGNRVSVTDGGTFTDYKTAGNSLNQYWQVGNEPVNNGSHHEIEVYQNIRYKYINDRRLASISGMDTSGQYSTYEMYYDALGRTAVRILNGATTYFIYDGEDPILEYRSWSSPSAANVYGKGIDEILMRTDSSVSPARTYYYQDDHQGSITHLTDGNGAAIETYRYDAFGKPTINGGALTASAYGSRFMFTGREYVPQFGIYEYRNRAYHPGLGRFMSEDPKLFDAGDYNLFCYCHNDPVDNTDPDGMAAVPSELGKWQARMQALQRQMARLRALIRARSWHSGGGIAIGQMSAAVGKLQTQAGQTSQGQGGVPARLVPHTDNKGNQIIHDYGHKKEYEWQVTDKKGNPFKATDLTHQETKVSQSNPNASVVTSETRRVRVSSQGILTDTVGFPRPLGPNHPSAHTVNTFRSTVYWDKSPYPLSTRLVHDIGYKDGVYTISAKHIEPPPQQ